MATSFVGPSFEGDDPAAADQGALVDRRELALVAVERTRMPMVVTDPRQYDNPIVLANQAFLDLTGYSAEDVVGRNCRFLQGPSTRTEDVAVIRDRLSDQGDHVEMEILNYRKDGTTFWNQLLIDPISSSDGTLLYYFASQKDVSARRRAEALEETERLLLKEVDHRAMNVLAIVQSIVRLSRAEDIDIYSGSILGRIDALARAHRLLAESGWAGADLAAVVAMETASIGASKISADGPAAMLPATLVQPITLVFRELLTNARDHGALSSGDGTVTITWKVREEHLIVEWHETGGQIASGQPVFGFGLNMVRGILDRQLGGRFEPHWDVPGLSARLVVPIKS